MEVESGTVKDTITEAVRDAITHVDSDTYYVTGSAIGPHPFPTMVRDFQSVIGKESQAQVHEGRKSGQTLISTIAVQVHVSKVYVGRFLGYINQSPWWCSG